MFEKSVILGLLRHLFTAGGGALVASGAVDQDTAAEATGAVVTLIGVIWSIFDKKKKA